MASKFAELMPHYQSSYYDVYYRQSGKVQNQKQKKQTLTIFMFIVLL
jgi:hypothetical protein